MNNFTVTLWMKCKTGPDAGKFSHMVHRRFRSYADAMDFARNGITYTSGAIQRVTLAHDNDECSRTLWCDEWSAESNAAGLADAP